MFLPNIGDPAVICGSRDVRFWPNSAAEAQSFRADKNQELSSSNEHFKRILVSETEVSVLTR